MSPKPDPEPSLAETPARPVTGRYDTGTDVLSVRFTDAAVVGSREVRPGVVVAYDAAGMVAGIEILEASAGRLAADQDLRRLAEAA